jgi:CBS domain-containing protein
MYVGMVDVLDLTAFVVSSFSRQQARAQAYDAADLVVAFGQQLGDVINMSQANYMAPVLDSSSLLDACEKYLQNGWHRVLVVRENLPHGRRMQDALGMVTQSDVVCTLDQSTASAVRSFKRRTLLELGVVDPEFQIGVASVTREQTLVQALELMLENSYSGIAVVDPDNGKLINCVSASDVKGISETSFGALSTSIGYVCVMCVCVYM